MEALLDYILQYQWVIGYGVIGYKMAVLQKVLEGVIGDTGDFGKSFGGGHRVHFFRIVVFYKDAYKEVAPATRCVH